MELKSELSVGNQKIDLTAAIRTPSGIFKRLIIQLTQSIWAYGVQVAVDNVDKSQAKSKNANSLKAKLGRNFDKIAEGISKKAALHGVCYGFWNYDKLQRFTALEYFPLKDERTSEDVAGIRFWRTDDNKPMYIQLYEIDGWSEYKRDDKTNTLELISPKQAYKLSVRKDSLITEIIGGENYNTLPIVPMYANEEQISELTKPIKNKIDLSDFVLSGFGDNVMRTKVIYWLLQGFSGNAEDLIGIRNEIERLGIMAPQSGDTTNVDTKLIDLPFGAVQYVLDMLEKQIYLDFMGFDSSKATGALTATEIKAMQDNFDSKASDFEWQAFSFVQKLFELQGIFTENITFKKKKLMNDMETTQMVIMSAPYLSHRAILEKLPIVGIDEIETIMDEKAMEDLGISDSEADESMPEQDTQTR